MTEKIVFNKPEYELLRIEGAIPQPGYVIVVRKVSDQVETNVLMQAIEGYEWFDGDFSIEIYRPVQNKKRTKKRIKK